MNGFILPNAFILVVGCWLLTSAAQAKQPHQPFENGAKCLFAGHSFFVPVALPFGRIATQNGYTAHSMQAVFAGGANGAPANLWNNRKDEIEAILQQRDIELFGLTVHGDTSESFDVYKNWFDLALGYNNQTAFFIGVPWIREGPNVTPQLFDRASELAGEKIFEIVQALRDAYPNNQVFMILYGKAASTMYKMFDVNNLPDITKLTGETDDALFSDDSPGHAGPMIREMSALSWMQILYGASVDDLLFSDWDEASVTKITAGVFEYNAPFLAPAPSPSQLMMPSSSPVGISLPSTTQENASASPIVSIPSALLVASFCVLLNAIAV